MALPIANVVTVAIANNPLSLEYSDASGGLARLMLRNIRADKKTNPSSVNYWGCFLRVGMVRAVLSFKEVAFDRTDLGRTSAAV